MYNSISWLWPVVSAVVALPHVPGGCVGGWWLCPTGGGGGFAARPGWLCWWCVGPGGGFAPQEGPGWWLCPIRPSR